MKWSHVSEHHISSDVKGVCCNSVVEKRHMWNDKYIPYSDKNTHRVLCNRESFENGDKEQ